MQNPAIKPLPPEIPRATERRHRKRTGMGVFVTDQELIEYLGLPEDTGRRVLMAMDRDPSKGFPKKQQLWGDRRYLPAVQSWLDATCGFKMPSHRRDAQ